MTETAPTTNGWDAEFAILKSRFPKVRDTILFCLHALQQNPFILIDDLKAQAEMHKLRVTTASLAGARRLLEKQDQPAVTTNGTTNTAALAATSAPQARRTRQPRVQDGLDIEGVMRAAVGQIQRQGDARVEQLRKAIGKAIELLQGALE